MTKTIKSEVKSGDFDLIQHKHKINELLLKPSPLYCCLLEVSKILSSSWVPSWFVML